MNTTKEITGSFTATGFQALEWDTEIWMLYQQGCWLLRNLQAKQVITQGQAEKARLKLAANLGWGFASDESPWDAEAPKQTSFHARGYYGLLRCETCGEGYGRNSWHASSPHAAYVYECKTNHRKRGTCGTPHIYEEHLVSRCNLLMQKLCLRTRIRSVVCGVLSDYDGVTTVLATILSAPPETLKVCLDETTSQIFYATVTREHTIIVDLNHGGPITVPLTPRWTPIMRKTPL
ncbi:zinc ribbon domain-containing protein [Propionimicrobium lymphophilum]|uniref:zinc ribbon domain-containing protein n=1 Tax=Propionimicrobium lymphophilum TaxID=33012 RepID=UPI0023F58990|nr:zinc ribbon domain-containing protein [Propionimicrobium lymphophilum]